MAVPEGEKTNIVYVPSTEYLIEIKTSSHPNSIFANRSDAQPTAVGPEGQQKLVTTSQATSRTSRTECVGVAYPASPIRLVMTQPIGLGITAPTLQQARPSG